MDSNACVCAVMRCDGVQVNGAERLMVMLIIERREREVWVQRTRVAGGPGFSSLAGFGGWLETWVRLWF